MNKPMNILLAGRAFDNMAGGVERQAIALLNELTARGHHVTLLTWDHGGAKTFYELSPAVTWQKLDMGDTHVKAGWSLRLRRAQKIHRIVKHAKPDVILAFQQGVFLAMRLYTLGMGIPVIAAERESPYRFDFTKDGARKNFIFQTFRLAKHITIQCESYRAAYPAYLRHKITTISNPVQPAIIYAAPEGTLDEPKILLCVARLSYAKNQNVLIDAFAQIAPQFPQWQLHLAGDGEDQEKITQRICALQLQDKIKLLGAVKNVPELYARSHLFCLPSRWEGFPNSLAEALAHGLPAVGFAGCGGVRDLIHHSHNGLLAQGNGNIQTLKHALAELMQDDTIRQKMGAHAIQSVKDYEPLQIYNQWEEFLKKMVRA